jgi:hypothetical protein
LLDGAGVEAAERGIQRVFASLPESGTEVDVFHQAGFMPYAGEDLFCLAQSGEISPPKSALAPRLQRPEDWPAIQKLCVAVTPQRIRQAEGGIAVAARRERNCQRYVLPGENGGELAAILSLCVGGLGHWLRVLVHPDAQAETEALIRWGVAKLASQAARPIYCNVRKYEGGVRASLQAVGFEPHATRALMVKHTVAWVKAPAQELVPALSSSAEPVPPAYRIDGEPEFQTPNGRLAAEHDA